MDPKVTELYNDYIHGDMPRRSFLKQLAVITGGATLRVMMKLLQSYPGKEPWSFSITT